MRDITFFKKTLDQAAFIYIYGKIRAEPLEQQLTRAYRAGTQILSSSGQIRAVESPDVTHSSDIYEAESSGP